jgi:hypothetical protein
MISQPATQPVWKMPLFGLSAAVVAHLPDMISGNGLAPFLLTCILLIVSGVIVLAVVAANVRRNLLPALAMLATFCLVAWLLFKVSYDFYTTGRWLAHSKQYKAEVMAEPQPANGELKHIEWDGWGFAGNDTVVYLVFEPARELTTVPETTSGRYVGIPCAVWRVRRLEPHWYYVVFYTNTDWTECTY